ncbi:MAG: hypothetical protein ACFCUE_08400 [Candidatus Bathyarchaeia archaeon]|jgi:hypothetical protein
MKRLSQITTQGWLPQDPYVPSHLKIISSRHRWIGKAKIVTGSTLLLIGLIALLVSIMAVQQTQQIREIHNDSCVLEPNQRSVEASTGGGYYPYYNIHSIEGQIIVEGKNVELNIISREPIVNTYDVNGTKGYSIVYMRDSPTHEVLSATVDGTYKFNLPANGEYNYECALQNAGSQQAKVTFQLNEIQTDIGKLTPGAITLLVTALPGTILIISGRKSRKATFEMPH